jgi:SagB-type dehydrogenase family enzyme
MSTPFDEFWTASRTTALTQRRLADRLREYVPAEDKLDAFELPGRYHGLRRSADRLDKLFRRRRSIREFGPVPLRAKALGRILGTLAATGTGRGYPSAGGLYPLRCYPLLLNVEHELNGRVCRYEPVKHALQDAGPCPLWPELAPVLGAEATTAPHFVLVFVLADEPLLVKYGPRGGRFGLIEAGAAIQSISMRLAADRLGGYLLGGGADQEVLDLLGLAHHDVRLAAVLAGGLVFP